MGLTLDDRTEGAPGSDRAGTHLTLDGVKASNHAPRSRTAGRRTPVLPDPGYVQRVCEVESRVSRPPQTFPVRPVLCHTPSPGAPCLRSEVETTRPSGLTTMVQTHSRTLGQCSVDPFAGPDPESPLVVLGCPPACLSAGPPSQSPPLSPTGPERLSSSVRSRRLLGCPDANPRFLSVHRSV